MVEVWIFNISYNFIIHNENSMPVQSNLNPMIEAQTLLGVSHFENLE